MFSQFDQFGYENLPLNIGGMLGRRFEQQYRCHSVAFIHRDNLESGGKIILPPSALEHLARLRIEYPMLFQISNYNDPNRRTHCGVLEFVAEEGNCYLPYWMMQHLLLEEGDLISIASATLPKGTFVRLRPHDTSFLDISNPRAVLENAFRNFSCLTKDDVICVKYNNNNYYLDVLEVKPGNAISIVEADVEVDFAAPLNYKEPNYKAEQPAVTTTASVPIPTRAGSGGATVGGTPKSLEGTSPTFAAFTGSGHRLDGRRPAGTGTTPLQSTSPVASSGMVFGKSPSASSGMTFGTSPAQRTNSFGASSAASTPPTASSIAPPPGSLVFGRSPSNGSVTRGPNEPAKDNNAAGANKQDPNFQAFSGKGYSLRG